jgi:histone H3/H4
MRLAHKAGVTRIGQECHEELQEITRVTLDEILRVAVISMKNANRKTVMLEDIRTALESSGKTMAYTKGMKITRCSGMKQKKQEVEE